MPVQEPEVVDATTGTGDGRPSQQLAPVRSGPVAMTSSGSGAVMPVLSTEQMIESLDRYQKLQQALDQKMPDQIMDLEGKKFRKKGYWRAIALAFGLNVEPVSERREVSGFFEDGRENFGYIIEYRATSPNGRSVVADGACFSIEKARRFRCPHPESPGSTRTLHFPQESCPDFDPNYSWKALPGQATEHNVRSHAHTRAYNRAVSNLVAFGEVSAEEVDREGGHGSGGSGDVQAPKSTGPLTVLNVEAKPTKNPRVTRFTVTFSDGRRAATIKDVVANAARALQKDGVEVEPVISQGKYGPELENIAAKDAGMDQRRPGTEEDPYIPGVVDGEAVEGSGHQTSDSSDDRAAEPRGKELVTSTREITKGGKTVYEIKTTRTVYYTDNEELRIGAQAACAAEQPLAFVSESRKKVGAERPVNWVTEINV